MKSFSENLNFLTNNLQSFELYLNKNNLGKSVKNMKHLGNF